VAKYGPVDAFLIVGGKDLTGHTFVLEEASEQIIEETHALGDSWEESLPVGVARHMLTANGGLYDDAALGLIAAFETSQFPTPTKQLVCFGMSGNDPGDEAVMLNGTYVAKWKRMGSRDALTKAHAEHVITGDRKEGKLIHGRSDSETSASGNTEGADSVDNLASSANGATGDLHVTALTLGGYTSVTFKVRDSADDITYADLITFANVTAAGTAERATAAGTVDRHLACSWLFNGAGSGQSVSFVIAVNRG